MVWLYKLQVNFDVLKKKNVFLFVSTLEITEEEISILRPIYETTKTGNQYKIVWVPIVEEWTDQLKKKFEFLKSRVPWYVVHHFGTIKGFKFIKEEWQFKKKPMVVVLSPQGKILHSNAFHMIQVWGLNAFPFTHSVEETLTQEASWVGSLVPNIPTVNTWVTNKQYSFTN